MRTTTTSQMNNHELINDLREAYMEVIPTPNIEEKLRILQPDSYVAVTCSPTKGVDETLDLSERLVDQGFRVAPHIAAKCVRNETHLSHIMQKLDALKIDSIFVPGGDRAEPLGDFDTAFELLKAINNFDHGLKEIGIAAHPEGHPDIADEMLLKELEKKKNLAQYIVTQMCFDADALGKWLVDISRRGIKLPVWIGLPGAIERTRLFKTSLRIGVGDSLRFLRKKSVVAAELMKSSVYRPDDLVTDIAQYKNVADTNIAGYHIFCFNQVESTEKWRNETIARLQ
ncbi:MAG: methylenetetrahydrofolate reductase [Woeseia sp.]|nr:methylenetetrahydrofolate reductase [Woeseia sp.]|tara:strand:- start:1979 stop:2833 length:855 start_codon:yes stop_codon:yes gene_type:complete